MDLQDASAVLADLTDELRRDNDRAALKAELAEVHAQIEQLDRIGLLRLPNSTRLTPAARRLSDRAMDLRTLLLALGRAA